MKEKDLQALIRLGANYNPPNPTKLEQAKRLLAALIQVMQEVGEEIECNFQEHGDCKHCPIYQLFQDSKINLNIDALKTVSPCEVF